MTFRFRHGSSIIGGCYANANDGSGLARTTGIMAAMMHQQAPRLLSSPELLFDVSR